MKYGLTVNVNETVKEIVRKAERMEKLGFDYVWVADVPSQRYSPTAASAIAQKTSNIKIGLGLLSIFLHKPHQISNSLTTLTEFYGDRFELLIGPGDLDQLNRVGISNLRHIPELLLKAKEEITEKLSEKGIEAPIWLGAQGPKILKLAKFFDGVLLNYAQPDFIHWAMQKMDLPNKRSTQVGIFAPSYVYTNKEEKPYRLLQRSSAIVALGASKRVLRNFGLYDKVTVAREKLEKGLRLKEVLADFPAEVAEKFSICMHSDNLSGYLSRLKDIGVEHTVFSYPQNFSKETIEALAKSLSSELRCF